MSETTIVLRSHFSDVPIDPEHPALLGLIDIDAGESKVFLNAVGVASRNYLLPDGRGSWAVLYQNGARRLTGTFAHHTLPVDSDIEPVMALGDTVTKTSTWQELESISPTVPDLGSKIKLTRLERAILRNLPHLEEVCTRPKAYLRFETTRVFVSQARRMPARAASYLAAHTEDWERPTLRSVQPKRVLAEVREDELDIYENRLATRLVDRLLRVINLRLAEIRKAQRILSELLDYSESTGGSHWRAERICSLWAETVTAAQSEKRARTTFDQLTSIRQRLLALKDSPLYDSIPREADVPDSLKMTNILATDPVYKYLAMLWLEWSRHVTRKQKAPAEVFSEYRTFCESFHRYCLLLVVRALSQLGVSAVEPDAGDRIAPGVMVRLSKKDLTLSVISSGVIQLSAKGRVLMNFLPLPAAINRARTDDELDGWLAEIYSASRHSGGSSHNIVLYLSTVAGSSKSLSLQAHRRLQTAGNEPSASLRRNFGLMPVSPWDIDCVERVARCLRWVVTGRELLTFPAAVNAAVPAPLKVIQLPRWLCVVRNRLLILRHPRPHEWRGFDIDAIWEAAKTTLDTAEDKEGQVDALLESGRTAPHERKALAQDATRLKKEVADARSAYQRLEVFRREIRRILDAADISKCPVCGTPADSALAFRCDANFYEFTCNDCEAQWGVRTCRCGERVPFLGTGREVSSIDRGPGWIDRYVGRDVLAVPHGEGAFECSACGGAV